MNQVSAVEPIVRLQEVERTLKSDAGEFSLEVARRCLDLYDDYFGVPYPLPKLDMVAIPEFAAGAMENWGLVTYREVDLLIAASASAPQRQRVTLILEQHDRLRRDASAQRHVLRTARVHLPSVGRARRVSIATWAAPRWSVALLTSTNRSWPWE